MANSNHVATYPSDEQLDRWQDHREVLGFQSQSEFVEAMVEAGLKKFGPLQVEPDETNHELRAQRNDLKAALDKARARIQDLEDAVYQGERQTIKRFVEENPGATYDDVIQHVIDTVPRRVTMHLDDLEGNELHNEDGEYYSADQGRGS